MPTVSEFVNVMTALNVYWCVKQTNMRMNVYETVVSSSSCDEDINTFLDEHCQDEVSFCEVVNDHTFVAYL